MNNEIFDNYIKLEHAMPSHADIVNINWCMGNTCNFACSYCPSSLHDGSIGWYDYDKVISFCDKVIDHYKGKLVYFEFTGGEVTLWKHFPDLCKHLKSRGADVGFISNSSRTIRWWTEILPFVDHICLSFHPEFGNKEHFTKVANLTSLSVKTHINIMMKPEVFDELFQFAKDLTKINNISMAIQPLLKDFGEEIYPYKPEHKIIFDNQYDLLIKHIVHTKKFNIYRGAMAMVMPDNKKTVVASHRFIGMEKNSWSGWKCWAGLEQMVIDTDGSILRGWCRVGGKIGHVMDENLQLPSEPVICNKQKCHCNFDIMCTKEKL